MEISSFNDPASVIFRELGRLIASHGASRFLLLREHALRGGLAAKTE